MEIALALIETATMAGNLLLRMRTSLMIELEWLNGIEREMENAERSLKFIERFAKAY